MHLCWVIDWWCFGSREGLTLPCTRISKKQEIRGKEMTFELGKVKQENYDNYFIFYYYFISNNIAVDIRILDIFLFMVLFFHFFSVYSKIFFLLIILSHVSLSLCSNES